MKYLVGYQLMKDSDFVESIAKHSKSISEVYFSWSNIANGRNKTTVNLDFTPWEAQDKQVSDLDYLDGYGLNFNLLLNGNCYGAKSCSKSLFKLFHDSIKYLSKRYRLTSVTTASPIIAKFIKSEFEAIEVRASVNMDIGTVRGMEYVSGYFDGFYMQRAFNRDKKQIEKLKKWCDKNGKKLYILANSGCMNHCSAHVFHDNLVSHEDEISQMDNLVGLNGMCWEYLKSRNMWSAFLSDSSFIRPEDIGIYEQWFDAVKLATRVHSNPVKVLESYINQDFRGSVLELCEPDHSGLLRPFLMENKNLPDDFTNTLLNCSKDCDSCGYCNEVLEKTLVDLSKYYI